MTDALTKNPDSYYPKNQLQRDINCSLQLLRGPSYQVVVNRTYCNHSGAKRTLLSENAILNYDCGESTQFAPNRTYYYCQAGNIYYLESNLNEAFFGLKKPQSKAHQNQIIINYRFNAVPNLDNSAFNLFTSSSAEKSFLKCNNARRLLNTA